MKVVKTDWRNRLNEENLTYLLRIKVEGPSLVEGFHKNYCEKAVSAWFHDKHRRFGQMTRKKYRKRKCKRQPLKEFELPSLFETSSESEDGVDFEVDD